MHEIYRRDLENWQGSDDEERDSDSDDTETDSDDEEGGVPLDVPPSSTEPKEQSVPELPEVANFEQTGISTVDTRPQYVFMLSYSHVQNAISGLLLPILSYFSDLRTVS